MKFEQAFYTWGLEQLSFAKEGLGICASSNLEDAFLKKCMTIGSKLNSEGTERTAEFVLYSPEFESFIGIGISPRDSRGDKRINKLCHFYIPAERGEIQEPADYLLEYPFQKVVAGQELSQQEIGKKEYDYSEILARYHYDASEENNQRRLAKLLWKAFRCAFGEDEKLFFVIDRGVHPNMDEDANMAREITWLLCMLMPRPVNEKNLYYKQLSYGVYTNENTDLVRFIFTDRLNPEENQLLVDQSVKEEEEIPAIYVKMAECAQESLETFQKFLAALLIGETGARLEHAKLQKSYYCWKMSQEVPVTRQEMNEEFCKVRMIVKNKADRKAWLQYLGLTEELTMDDMIDYWQDAVRPLLGKYEELTEEEQTLLKNVTKKFLCRMYQKHRKNYRVMVRKIPTQLQKEILCELHQKDSSYLEEEYHSIDSVEDFNTFADTYAFFHQEEAFVENLMKTAMELHEDSDRAGRNRIFEIMGQLDGEAWKEYYAAEVSRRLEQETIEELAERDYAELRFDVCKEKWLQKMCRRMEEELEEEQNLSDTVYENLLAKLHEICRMNDKQVKKFVETLWECAYRHPKRIKRCLQFQFSQSIWIKPHSIWSEVTCKDYEYLYGILKEHPDWEETLSQDQAGTSEHSFACKSYFLWKKVYVGCKVERRDMPDFSYNRIGKRFLNGKEEKELRELLQTLQKMILEKQHYTYIAEDVFNYFFLHLEEQKLIGVTERKLRKRERFKEIRNCHKTFADAVKSIEYCFENREVFQEWKQLKQFLVLSDYEEMEVKKENYSDICSLLRKEQGDFEDILKKIRENKEAFEKMMQKECKALEEEIQAFEKEAENIQQQIEELQQKKKTYKNLMKEKQIKLLELQEMTGVKEQPRKEYVKREELPSFVTAHLPEQEQEEERHLSAIEIINNAAF